MKEQYLLVAEDYDVEKIITCEEHEIRDKVMSFLKSELYIEDDVISVYKFIRTYDAHRDVTHIITEETNDKKT